MTWISQPEHKNRMRFAVGKYRDYCNWLLYPIEKVPKVSSPPPPSMRYPKHSGRARAGAGGRGRVDCRRRGGAVPVPMKLKLIGVA